MSPPSGLATGPRNRRNRSPDAYRLRMRLMNAGESTPSRNDVSYHVAWPSLAQTSAHRLGATLSPNHWCASSCTMTGPYEVAGRLKLGAEYSDMVWVSSANPNDASPTREPYDENGYGPTSASMKSR